jgi:hypothetical protein
MNKKFLHLVFASISGLASTWVSATDFDGSKPLICATVDAHACDAGEVCLRALPVDFGLPKFLHIDFSKKTIAGPEHTTPIRWIENGESQILLEGTERGFAWTIALDKADGTLTGTIVDRADAFVLFGDCTRDES